MDNSRKQHVGQFNHLKLHSVPQKVDQKPERDQSASCESSRAVPKPLLPSPHIPAETDLYNRGETEIPGNTQEAQETPVSVENCTVQSADRPRQEVQVPVWMKGFIS